VKRLRRDKALLERQLMEAKAEQEEENEEEISEGGQES
jgi:hypothetical protein